MEGADSERGAQQSRKFRSTSYHTCLYLICATLVRVDVTSEVLYWTLINLLAPFELFCVVIHEALR
jgi:hypothetical protein